MTRFALGLSLLLAAGAVARGGAPATSDPSPQDFAYKMRVIGTGDAAAYRLSLPLAVYRKITHPDLGDLRVFNGSGEAVPFALERPAAGTLANAARALPIFPLKDDSSATLSALRVTIESGKGAVNVQTGGSIVPSGRTNTYLVDARTLDVSVSALRLEWPADAADFAGRLKVEASDSLADWRVVAAAAPIANLRSNGERLVEQRVELAPTRAKYWRLAWVGAAAPFVLTAVLAEPGRQSVEARHTSLATAGTPVPAKPGEFEFDLGARLPVDRVNLDLPETNTVVEVELLSRARVTDGWRAIRRTGFYRLKSDGAELRNGPIPVESNADRYWLVRADRRGGGLGVGAPRLAVEWIPHEVVFVARGEAPFFIAYGNVSAASAAVSLAAVPKNVAIEPATLADEEALGGDARLRPPPTPYPWKTGLLWSVLILAAGLLAWMAYRLSRESGPTRG
jgi:hypothetical protein